MAESETEPETEPITETPRPYMMSREPLISPEVKDVMDLRSMIGKDKPKEGMSIFEWIMLNDYIDRRDERKEEKEKKRQQPQTLTKEAIVQIVKETATLPSAEPPEAVQKLTERMEKIEQENAELKQEKRDQQLIEKATEPLKAQLEKERTEREHLKEEMKELTEKTEKPSTPSSEKGSITDNIKELVAVKDGLKELGMIKDEKGATISYAGPDGLPIKGEIPGPIVWIPWFANQMKESIVDIISEVGKRLTIEAMATPTPKIGQSSKLIKLPETPNIQPPSAPKPEVPQIEPKEHLIKMPEVPIKETKQVATAPIELAPLDKPDEHLHHKKQPVTTEEESAKYTKEALEKMKMPQLWRIAKELRISNKGKKAELIQRILDAQKGEEPDERKTETSN